MKKIIMTLLVCLFAISAVRAFQKPVKWVGTWATSPQWITKDNMPPSPGLSNNSLRQVVRVSIGGDNIRIKLSNEYSKTPLIIRSAYIAVSKGGSNIDASTGRILKFEGKKNVTVDAGKVCYSDKMSFRLSPLQQLSITINYGETPTVLTGHPGSRTTSYIIPGSSKPNSDFSKATTTDHWYTISAIDVEAGASAGCVAILGNSITDGRGSTTNMQDRWPDQLATRLQSNASTRNIGVLNLGIGGNCVLWGGLGDPAVKRYNRDIISQNGVKWVIIYEGVNDLGGSRDGKATADELIAAYKRMIAKAHSHGLLVYGATITPFKNHSYFREQSELGRSIVNEWIRHGGWFDRVIDFDKCIRDVTDTLKINDALQSDYLHPNAEGYKRMGGCIDLNLFTHTRMASTEPKDKNFHIYLAFGQSNMEGQGKIEEQDKTVSDRYKMMASVDCSAMGRTAGEWYPAVPPLCRCSTGLCPVDYFGRTLVDSLPSDIKIGVINISVAGCKIELFDKYGYKALIDSGVPGWMQNMINAYGGNPYAKLIETARKAQCDGVIHGILLHQGESNTGQQSWPAKVRTIYYNILNDLSLDPDSVPLIAGEVVNADQKGACASMNPIIDTLPRVIPNSFVVSSAGLPCNQMDHLHFVAAGYRTFGQRYAAKMLEFLKNK
jgi:lysophospholipase L1-like esterase